MLDIPKEYRSLMNQKYNSSLPAEREQRIIHIGDTQYIICHFYTEDHNIDSLLESFFQRKIDTLYS